MSTHEARTATAIRQDLARITLGVLTLLMLIAGSLWVLRPFLLAAVWATMLVVATWPVLLFFQARFHNRRGPAVAMMTVIMLLLVIVPLWAAIVTLLSYTDEATELTRRLAANGLPQPPGWVGSLPLVGAKLQASWTRAANAGPEGLSAVLAPYATQAARWVLVKAGGLTATLVELLLVVAISAILYATGETAALGVRRFCRRIAGARGDNAVELAGQAIRGVALGVGATAVVQTLLAGIGLVVAGVPFVALLTAIAFFLCIAQMGPALVLFPAAGWLYWSGNHVWGVILLLWAVVVQVFDNVLRPILIKKGADLPLVLIFSGVIGGMLGFGLIGIFVGPVLLAVSYRLLEAWVQEGLEPEA
jgi:predicted PurR-regulated permease PerM